ncbi:EGF-like, conserved site-containing protein [Tanacetum coccineum]
MEPLTPEDHRLEHHRVEKVMGLEHVFAGSGSFGLPPTAESSALFIVYQSRVPYIAERARKVDQDGNLLKIMVEGMHVLGFDAHALTHFRDERKRWWRHVTEQAMDTLTASLWGSHREKRLMRNEIMMGSVDTRSVVLKMTLALLEDSRWYQANYSMADHLDSGHTQGTDKVYGTPISVIVVFC